MGTCSLCLCSESAPLASAKWGEGRDPVYLATQWTGMANEVPTMWILGTKKLRSVSIALRGHVSCIEKPEPATRAQDEGQDGSRETDKALLVPLRPETFPGF